jgi:23S rRNA A1618 N6-methylase RlmF
LGGSRIVAHGGPRWLIPALITPESGTAFTFTMCNPPFYSSEEEMMIAAGLKVETSHAAPTAATNELITDGGEVEFVAKMIRNSVQIGTGVR